jgi:Ca2+-binding RTX toxin-like protein
MPFIVLTEGDDTYTGSNQSDNIDGRGGNDTLIGGAGLDALTGGAGSDILRGGADSDRLWGDPDGASTGALYVDTLEGGPGNDELHAGLGDNVDGGRELDGAQGYDVLYYDCGAAVAGVSLDFRGLESGAPISVGGGVLQNIEVVDDVVGSRFDDSITLGNGSGFWEVMGRGGNDTIIGGDGQNLLLGEDGNDTIFGREGDDWLFGGNGDDRLAGGSGANRLTGGLGNDTYVVDSQDDLIRELADEGIDTVMTASDFRLGTKQSSSYEHVNIENLTLTGTADIYGNGNDLDNALRGNHGANILRGGIGDDAIDGANGDDRLIGGAGRDVLTGGGGMDRFRFDDLSDMQSERSLADRVCDFSQSDHDKIKLHLIDADITTAGTDDAFVFVGAAAFSHTAGELRFDQVNGNTYVSGDVDGDGLADFFIRFDGLVNLVAADFTL